MMGALILIVILYGINQPILSYLKKKFPFLSVNLLNGLYAYHTLFWLIYYVYQLSHPSDSKAYYENASTRYDSWFAAFGSDTKFIEFVGYPFAKSLGFSYETMLALFSWFGYLGFVFFYIFFKENVKTKVKVLKLEFITLLLFLPNMHFWTVAFSKGSLIFLGIGLFAYAMKFPQKRILALLLGSFIVFQIRPHVFLFLGAGAVVGYFTGKEQVPFYQKLLVYVSFIGALIIFSDQILAMANINLNEGIVEGFEEFATERAANLSDSGSGVNINAYPLPLKLFTFWFRPLFFDAPGALGLFVSLENLLYLYLTSKLFDKGFIKYLTNSSSLVKMSLTIFLTSSLALSFVMSNLGIAMRQKSMVMYFLFFVVLSYLDYKRRIKYKRFLKQKKLMEAAAIENATTVHA
ncbi:hypothetical protein CLV24_106222 [Pontibacter ummariensis]|uniref:EpsG family protein n=1 Tax=Pontibacter ummariensis TaxID=1610492 RepID=A0A239EKL1_9BACT|nr:hypothetical protein [Pontibacter ummariensis]PRY13307.1 hypothetical protein CLV24_106222 [Pontibacter ummariensis]SNS45099.1 hypothetical protein SAMN06296052_106222 [Pontibacter ummariensis]